MTQDDFDSSGAWGLLATADLQDCDTVAIRDERYIRLFVEELCRGIGMRTFGPCQIVHFGGNTKVAGYSMVQLIDTSLVSGHFVDSSNAAYLDVFSCRYFNASVLRSLAEDWFLPKHVTMHEMLRGARRDT
jgi:S-adenosylmethionine/arginine decarboxylase-like enzyme